MDGETANQFRLPVTPNPTFDCNPGCRSKQHASQLISSITKGTELQIRLFLSRCHNAESVVDEFGRNTLHVTASCGQDDVVEWLIAEQGASVAAVDHESRWTALHRAVFYGQLSTARLLIAYGSSLQKRDREGLTPLDIIMKDRLPHVEFLHTGLDELFTWGANSTFTLGHENMQPRKLPEQVESFRRRAISIKRVAMSKYHSVFLSDSGQVYTCGHGLGGRLGQGDEQTYLVPKLIDVLKKEICVDISAAVNHTVMLMESGMVYSCGVNSYHQLGQFPPPEKVLAPKPVNSKSLKGRHIIGVCAQRFHTIFYTVDTVFTCGLNAGQLGHYKVGGESLVSNPRPVAALCHKDTHIQQVTASDAATVVVTSKGDVYALHEYQCRKIVSKWLDIAEVHCSGGHLDHSTDSESLNEHGGAPLTVVLLTTTGKVFVCYASSDCVTRRCVWMIGRPLFATHLALGANVLTVVTKDGEAFTGNIPKHSQSSSNLTRVITPGKDSQHFDTFSLTLSDLVLKDDVIEVSLNRVPLVHRATAVSTDQQGANISVLQSHPNASITCIPSVRQSEMKFHMAGLLSDAHQDDCVHDVILQVGSERLPLHRYILSQRSEFFRRQFALTLDDGSSRPEDVSFTDHSAPMTVLKIDLRGRPIFLLRQLLQFIYSDSCDFVSPGCCIQSSGTLASGYVKDSAAEVKAGGQKGKKSKKKSKDTNSHSKDASSPDEARITKMFEILKEMAKEFGVTALVKKLDAVQLVDGYVVNAPGRSMPSSSLRFERKSSCELSDVFIEGGDGSTIACHKCILVARLEYFRSMFSSSWIEMTNSTTLRLPFPSDVLRIVIEYLYTDCCTVFQGRCDTELLCSVLVAADQLLIGRLRDECEAALAQLLNLRNVCELLEFATVYNASQLVVTCHQFITINLAALLETRSLDVLSDDVIVKLTEYYKENIIGMNRRRITPYSSWPDFQVLEFLEKSVMEPMPSKSGGAVATPGVGKKTGMPRRRTRTKSSEGSIESAKQPQKQVSTEEVASKERDLMDTPIEEEATAELAEVGSTVVSPILNVAPLATGRKSLILSEPTATITKSLSADNFQMEPISEKHFSLRDIIFEEMAKTTHSPSVANDQQTAASSSRWPKKMSQKERRRISLVTEKSVTEKCDGTINVQTEDRSGTVRTASAEISGISANPWKAVDNVVHSFKDLMLTEKTSQQKTSFVQAPNSNSRPTMAVNQSTTSTNSDSNRMSWGIMPGSSSSSSLQLTPVTPSSEPASPTESPWHLPAKVSDACKSSQATGALSAARFSDIVEDEMTQVQTLRRTTNKSLSLIQIEERAMSELLDFYKAPENVHQYITVERVPSTNAQPLWAATQRQSFRLV